MGAKIWRRENDFKMLKFEEYRELLNGITIRIENNGGDKRIEIFL